MNIDKLIKTLTDALPGADAQLAMSPGGLRSRKYLQAPDDARRAAVMLLLFQKDQEWHTLFIQRSKNIHDKHSGQISFPGGRYEEADGTFENCALREVEEEIGISPKNVKIIGKKTNLYVFASDHLVYPFVGIMSDYGDYELQASEVQHIIEVPLSYLQDPKIVMSKKMDLGKYKNQRVPYFDIHGQVLWGATAMMVSEFIQLYKSSQK